MKCDVTLKRLAERERERERGLSSGRHFWNNFYNFLADEATLETPRTTRGRAAVLILSLRRRFVHESAPPRLCQCL